MNSKLVIFDGNAIMYRAFHALPPLTSKDGVQINALYGLVSMLINIQKIKTNTYYFCFDEKEKHSETTYLLLISHKDQKLQNELIPQFKNGKRVFKIRKDSCYSKSGYEADDVIGTIATKIKVDEVIIVTGDRDILH